MASRSFPSLFLPYGDPTGGLFGYGKKAGKGSEL